MEKKEFIKQWMKTYDPDTFKQSNNGRYFYRSEDLSSGIDLECFFEELLTDFEGALAKESEQQINCNLPDVINNEVSVCDHKIIKYGYHKGRCACGKINERQNIKQTDL